MKTTMKEMIDHADTKSTETLIEAVKKICESANISPEDRLARIAIFSALENRHGEEFVASFMGWLPLMDDIDL